MKVVEFRQIRPPAIGIWIGLSLIYALLRLARHYGQVTGPVDWYLADLVCLPVVLGVILAAQRWYHCSPSWTLPRWHGLFATVIYTVYFEAVLPRFKSTAIGDVRDGMCYLLGWMLFELLINRGSFSDNHPSASGLDLAGMGNRFSLPTKPVVAGSAIHGNHVRVRQYSEFPFARRRHGDLYRHQ